MAQHSERTFVTLRTDGLAERLRAMLSAMVLAEVTGGRFVFNWQMMRDVDLPFHSVRPADETFSPEFLAAHHRAELDAEALVPLKSVSEDLMQGVPGKGEMVRVDQDGLLQAHGVSNILPADELAARVREAFWKVGFSEELEYARRLASEVPLGPEATALHLRAGDVVYGRYRFMGRYAGKVYPFPLAIRVIEDCQARGVRPIIFGQDIPLHDWLKERYDVIDPREILAGENLSELQLALFELTLMCRCQHIFAGTSGFATLPGLIAGVEVVRPSRYAPAAVMLDILRQGLTPEPEDPRISHPQRALACWSVLTTGRGILTPDEEFDWAARALAHDPVNTLYAMHAASALFRMGLPDRAEAVLLGQLSQRGDKLRIFETNMRVRPFNGIIMASEYLDVFRAAAERGAVIAAFYLAFADQSLGDRKQAIANAEQFLARRPDELAYLDVILTRTVPIA